MKKILSLILAGLMTVSCAAFVAADDAAVEATDPVQDYAISFLETYGIYKGGEGLTNEDDIQRYQMALFVSRISTGWVDDATWEDGTANDSTFADINDEPANKYLGALSYANQNGIIEGYSATKFAPYDNITYRDALTMVVRTLGYKGLSYPWGNIEKAVELGLTEGVDAAYTDVLTRGEVAVIIYNALFANTAKGETLAKSIFDVDFGFQNIIIVSTDEYSMVADADGSEFAPAGYVGFKAISETGVISDKVYYVKSEELGLTAHEEEIEVGAIYVALFEIKDNNYVTILDAESLNFKTVQNNGITDNEGVKYETMPIAAELANYKLVTKYTEGFVSYTYEDLKVYGYNNVVVYDIDGNKNLVGIDYENQNIMLLTPSDVDKDGTVEKNEGVWTTVWYYNETLNKYYEYALSTEGEVYVNWMSDAEFVEWYEKVIKKVVANYSELTLLEAASTFMTAGKAPYSKLRLYDIDGDTNAEIATYKSYKIGMFSTNTTDYKCYANNDGVNHSAGVKMPTYVITDLDGAKQYSAFVEAGHEAHDDSKEAGFAWVNVDPSVTTFVKEDGSYVGGVVLYNVNETTGEIEIVKHITDGENDDADSKIITGILQAYSTKNKTVTIDGTVYPIDYDNLIGDMYAMADTNTPARKNVGKVLDEQYMQYITAVICDGYVVDTDLRGNDSDAIVVLGYAGITSDGYIAVYGYKTDDLSLKVYKINTYNGWKKGDYRYYPENANDDAAFAYGTLYTVKSYDAETDSYGVYTENIETVLAGATPVRVTFKNGYRSVQPMSLVRDNGRYSWEIKEKDGEDVAPTIVSMTSADKYVIVTSTPEFMPSSNIYVYDGIVDDDVDNVYAIDALLVGGLDSKTLVLYTLDNVIDDNFWPVNVNKDIVGWAFLANSYDVGYVVYEKGNGTVLDAAYDEAIAGDYYLLGSTLSEVTVFNLLTGTRDTVIASSNIDLINGHIYKTIGGQILWDVTDDCASGHNFLGLLSFAYASKDLDYADYIIEPAVTLRKEDLTKLNLAFELGLLDITDIDDADGTDKAIANKLIHNDFAKKIYVVSNEWTWDWYEHNSNIELTDPIALDDNTTYKADLVYEVATGKVVIYIFDDEAGENIVVDNDTKEYTGKILGINAHEQGASYAPAWTVTLDGKTRNFDIEVSYTVEGEFAPNDTDPECMDDLVGLRLTSLKVAVVELTKDADGKWAATAVADCEGNEILHDLLAAKGIGFGGVNYDAENLKNALSVIGKGVKMDEEDITVKSMTDCGLVTEITFDLSDYDVELNREADDDESADDVRSIITVDTARIDLGIVLKTKYNSGSGAIDTFLGMIGYDVDLEDSTSDAAIKLGEADEDDSIIVLG